MRSVGIAELKNQLSRYLQMVRRGEVVLVRDRDRVVARIERVEAGAAEGDADRAERLASAGIIRLGRGRLTRRWLQDRPRVKADVVAALLAERDESP